MCAAHSKLGHQGGFGRGPDYAPKHSSGMKTKINLRKWILRELGVESPKILDVYCGPGAMWKEAYGKTPNYLGLDRETYWDERNTIVCENTRFLRNANLDIDAFDVFDLDAFGSPFYPLAIICHRIRWTRADKVAVILTDGAGFNAKMNSLESGFLNYVGMARHKGANVHFANRNSAIRMMIEKSCAIARATPENVLRAKTPDGIGRPGMRYIAYLMRRLETP